MSDACTIDCPGQNPCPHGIYDRAFLTKPYPPCEYPSCANTSTMTFGTDYTPVCNQHSLWHQSDPNRAPAVEPEQPTRKCAACAQPIATGMCQRPGCPASDKTTKLPGVNSIVATALGVCDGQCVPHECVCPSAEQRVAEIQAAVKAERARIEQYIDNSLDYWKDENARRALKELLAVIRGDA